MRKIILISIALLCSIAFNSAIAGQADELFRAANTHYQSEEYSSAIDAYEEILKNGYESPEIYYNLGNAYFKSDMIPSSILNYERAKRIAPDDEEIKFNLKVANLKIVDKVTKNPTPFYTQWWNAMREFCASGLWAGISILFLWLSVSLIAGFLFVWHSRAKKILFLGGLLSMSITVFALIFAYQSNEEEIAQDKAIIFATTVYVKSAPKDSGTDLFLLHEGSKVQLLDQVGEWVKIRLSKEKVGWMHKSEIEVI